MPSPAFRLGRFLGPLTGLAGRGLRGDEPVQETTAAAGAVDAASFEAIADLVTWHDACGDVVRASGGAERVTGAAAAALLGQGLLQRVHVPDRPAFLKGLSDAANGLGEMTFEFRLHLGFADPDQRPATAGGRVAWAEMRVFPLRNPGQGPSVLALTRDVSLRHRQAEEAERARREAERADEIKGRFLATVSHELRTPLNAIIGFSELLGVDHPFVLTEERRKEYAVIIRNSGQHLLEIVNTLLDMSKIETGNFNFLPEPFGFRDLATSCCDLMQLKAEEAKVELRRRFADDLPEVIADRRACRQILINLLSNAVKFTPTAGTVTVALSRQGDQLVIEVADTGIGIPEADLPRLCNPFFQSGEVHRRSREGTGLGLSVVRGLVGLHRGTLTIESGAGAGTTVSVRLPIGGFAGPATAPPAPVHTLARPRPRPIERLSA